MYLLLVYLLRKSHLEVIVAILKILFHLVFEFNASIVQKDKSVPHDRQICVVSIFACRRILQCIRDAKIKGNNSVPY